MNTSTSFHENDELKEQMPSTPRSSPADRRAWLILLLLMEVICLSRLPSLHEPLERDIGACMVIGYEMLHGRPIYEGVWEIKPPGLALTCLAGILAFGYEPHTVFLLGILASILTLLGIYYAASAEPFGRMGGLCAAVFWTIIQADIRLQANLPNTESFINIFIVFAFGLLLRWKPDGNNLQWRRAIGVGTLFAIASLYKQVAIAFPFIFSAVHILLSVNCQQSRKQALLEVILMASIGAVAWGIFLGWLLAADLMQAYWDAGIEFIRGYSSGSIPQNLAQGLKPSVLVPEFMLFLLPLAFLSLLGILLKFHLNRRSWSLLLGYAVAAQVAMAAPGQFFPHYYQYSLPIAAIGGGWGVWALCQYGQEKASQWIWKAIFVIVVVSLGIYAGAKYRLTPREWSEIKYGDVFVSSYDLVPVIDSLLEEDETFYEWGAECALYLYTQRRIPTAIFHFYPMVWPSPFTEKFEQQALEELQADPPELAIVQVEFTPEVDPHFNLENNPVLKWVYTHYSPISNGVHNEDFRLMALKGGALERRLQLKTKSFQ